MAKKTKLTTTSLDNYGSPTEFEIDSVEKNTAKQHNIHPNSLKNLHPRTDGKTEKKYMQLDIKEFEDYLNRMAKYKGMTRTKYIQSLIKKDYEAHIEEYELLKNLSRFDK